MSFLSLIAPTLERREDFARIQSSVTRDPRTGVYYPKPETLIEAWNDMVTAAEQEAEQEKEAARLRQEQEAGQENEAAQSRHTK